jgi:vitellogenic carboxypeptidase-like protein
VNKPILLWLQGGPGAASTFGLFVEIGSLQLINRTFVQKREHSWTDEFHVLYIDSPVGTGYSFGDSDDCYSHDGNSVTVNLYEALKQFFTLFSEYKSNPFFLTGESYAGKYVPSLGYHIHKRLPESREYFNFTGIAIGA